MAKFDAKTFNSEAFGSYIDTIPQPNRNELIKSRVLVPSETIKNLLSSQTGSFYATMPIYGRIGGDALNYDGNTDITATSMDTFEQSIIAVGRAKAWTERDFSFEITAGVDFMSEVAKQVAYYWDDVNTGLVMSVIKGIFSMTGEKNLEFVNGHTLDITSETAEASKVGATTLNTAIQQACGDKRAKFSLAFMHSAVATNLENLKLLQYLKYTDAQGIERPLPMASWNGRLVIVDDGMPVETDESGAIYTTYIFGDGAIEYADLGVKVPHEMDRDPAKNGGQDTLYTRERLCFAPKGISFTKTSVATLSPTNAELENGANWTLVSNGADKVYNHKDIAVCRVISRG